MDNPFSGMNLLWVDGDNTFYRPGLKTIEQQGMAITPVATYQAAYEHIKGDYDFVLMELLGSTESWAEHNLIPWYNPPRKATRYYGLDLLGQVRGEGISLPVGFYTKASHVDLEDQLIAQGFDYSFWLEKPIAPKKLYEIIASVWLR